MGIEWCFLADYRWQPKRDFVGGKTLIGGILLAEHVCGRDVKLQGSIAVVNMSDQGIGIELQTSELAILRVLPNCGMIFLQLASRSLVRGFLPRSRENVLIGL